ncbi:hypothetical protein C2G38_2106855 [Gigaspora rosea]|uniref:Uncharacterized protein n=1 Tax=Gigaspora rosea TaxID=44941 RepID=A0A397ULX1_9GLOM|nr:hypothetical protein C2G38_2106855 [Gigaspora rosea]
MKLFGDQVINNKIAVLTNLKRKLIKEFNGIDKKVIRKHLEISEDTKALLKFIDYNLVIFPDPEYKEEDIGETMEKIIKMIV